MKSGTKTSKLIRKEEEDEKGDKIRIKNAETRKEKKGKKKK